MDTPTQVQWLWRTLSSDLALELQTVLLLDEGAQNWCGILFRRTARADNGWNIFPVPKGWYFKVSFSVGVPRLQSSLMASGFSWTPRDMPQVIRLPGLALLPTQPSSWPSAFCLQTGSRTEKELPGVCRLAASKQVGPAASSPITAAHLRLSRAHDLGGHRLLCLPLSCCACSHSGTWDLNSGHGAYRALASPAAPSPDPLSTRPC